MAHKVLGRLCIPALISLDPTFQSFNQPEVTWTQLTRILQVFKAHHVIAPHFVGHFLFVVAA
jgi:hypothetical protein